MLLIVNLLKNSCKISLLIIIIFFFQKIFIPIETEDVLVVFVIVFAVCEVSVREIGVVVVWAFSFVVTNLVVTASFSTTGNVSKVVVSVVFFENVLGTSLYDVHSFMRLILSKTLLVRSISCVVS